WRPTRSDAVRIRSTVSACSSGRPCAKFSRAMSIPAAIMFSRTAGSRDAGPIVATILVARIVSELYRPASPDGRLTAFEAGQTGFTQVGAGPPSEGRIERAQSNGKKMLREKKGALSG